ncbi:MAG: flagellar hook protein FlgE [Clostridia bacterium]|nr:flagellar hook protein FlgE [Clostridia bacterium]
MMRSMYSGVSGLQVHQVKMDTIGNNIANVNTVGFKASKVTFSEVFAQTIKGAGAPQEGRGGTNPQQVGLGAGLGAISVQHTKGSTQRTDNPTDIMIDGNGFFVVSADATAQNKFYTRAGNFSLDKLGYLVNPNGYKLLDSDGVAIRINKSETKNATASTTAELTGNLNFNYDAAEDFQADNSIYTTTLDVYDSVGNVSTIDIKFGEKITSNPATPVPPATASTSYRSVEFSNPNATTIGNLQAPPMPDGGTGTSLFAEFDSNGNFVRLVNNGTIAGGYMTAVSAATVGPLTITSPGAEPISIGIDNSLFSGLTHYAQTTDAKATSIDGNSAGALDSFAISSSGEVVGTFTNGERKTLAIIGLADFDNAPGLMKVGGNLYTDTPNSGVPKFGEPGTGSFGALTPGALEMSNVDLSQEFTDMITTQRGFQANSRVITTTDEMLQELVNLKR